MRFDASITWALGALMFGCTAEILLPSISYKFDLSGGVNAVNGNVSGTWSKSAHRAAGEIARTVKGGVISARATGPYFSAHLSLRTTGNTQAVSLNSPDSQISSVTMQLARAAQRCGALSAIRKTKPPQHRCGGLHLRCCEPIARRRAHE